ncbi:hypothetical protein [Embleya sp. NPDC059237]|uniref:hypothetical protein n=1 Tax=Embleya sp. NPDC059237 TaxID=3346784 RepID=UPI0036A838EB
MTTIDSVRPTIVLGPCELPGTRRQLPRAGSAVRGWCLHLFSATGRAEDAAVCLDGLLRAELGDGGALNSTPALTTGTHPRHGAADRGLPRLVRAVTDPAHADTQHRVALVLSRHTTDDSHTQIAARVLSPHELPPYEQLHAFIDHLVHSADTSPAPILLPANPSPRAHRRPPSDTRGPRAWPRMGRDHDTRIPQPRPPTR